MKILGKRISSAFVFSENTGDILFGIHVVPGECDCCGNPVSVTRIGLGLIELDVFVQNEHK